MSDIEKAAHDYALQRVITPEAFGKFRRQPAEPLLTLLDKGYINRDQLAAGEEIRKAFEEITSPVAVRTSRAESSEAEGSFFVPHRCGGHLTEWAPDGLVKKERRKKYILWARALDAEALHPVIDVVVYGDSPGTVDRHRKAYNGKTLGQVVKALDLWCELYFRARGARRERR